MMIFKKMFISITVAAIPALTLAMLSGCGKKGPPLPPLPPEKEAVIEHGWTWQRGAEIKAGSFIKAEQTTRHTEEEGNL